MLMLFGGCSASESPPSGNELGPCYPNSTCHQGLTCLSGICVKVPDGSSIDGPVQPDSTSSDGPVQPDGPAADGKATDGKATDGEATDGPTGKGVVQTIAGSGSGPGFSDGPALSARFYSPTGVAVDSQGTIYVADRDNHRIRTIAQGKVSTLAGSGAAGFLDGTVTSARFFAPTGVALDNKGNVLVADAGNHRIRKISGGMVTTLAGTGSTGYHDDYALKATFNSPRGLAVDSFGAIYIADHGSSRVRRIHAGKVTTSSGLTGGGYKYSDFGNPTGVAVDGVSAVYVVEQKKHRIVKVFANKVSVLAGVDQTAGMQDGPAQTAKFNGPSGVAVDSSGTTVFVADLGNHRVRKVASGQASTLAGAKVGFVDGPLGQARFNGPYGVAIDPAGRIVIADVNNNRIRLLIP